MSNIKKTQITPSATISNYLYNIIFTIIIYAPRRLLLLLPRRRRHRDHYYHSCHINKIMLPLWNIKTDCAYPATEDSTPEETERLDASLSEPSSSSADNVSGAYNNNMMYLKNPDVAAPIVY